MILLLICTVWLCALVVAFGSGFLIGHAKGQLDEARRPRDFNPPHTDLPRC